MTKHEPLYPHSRRDALEMDERDQWRASYRLNCDCARAIERAISENYHDNALGDCVDAIIERYGFDRVNYVLANTIQQKNIDGRFSDANKRWASEIYIPDEDVRWHFCVESHPVLANAFVDEARSAWKRLGLYESDCCTDDTQYGGKLLLIKPSALAEEYRKPEYQLFYAVCGFGCDPEKLGRKVYGAFLFDGDQTSFPRSSFLGVMKPELIPEWAQEKVDEITEGEDIQTEDTDQTDDEGMGGMT